MTFTPPPIFITDKEKSVNDPTRLPVAFRSIERYMGSLRIPTGGGGGGGVYASLTGPGETTTPGDLTQQGNLFTIGDTFEAITNVSVELHAGPSAEDQINLGGGSGIQIRDSTVSGIFIQSDSSSIDLQAAGNTSELYLSTNSVTLRANGPSGATVVEALGTSSPSLQLYCGSTTASGTAKCITATANNGILLNYNQGGGSPTLGIVITDASTGTQTNLFVYNGNPNGHVLPGNKGNIVFDVATPGIWIATGITSSSWTMYTLP